MSQHVTTAHISVENFQSNLSYVRSKLTKNVKLMATVKANAYGHGVAIIAQAACDAGADYLGIVSVDDLEKIRAAKLSVPCLFLNYIDESHIENAIKLQGSVTVISLEFAHKLQAAAKQQNARVKVHIKVDTGMNIGCCKAENVRELAQYISDASHLELEGVFSHFAEADNPDKTRTTTQLELFKNCLADITAHGIKPGLVHCANSAGTLAHSDSHFDMVRPGIALFCVNPFPLTHPLYQETQNSLKPVLTISSKIASLYQLEIGQTAGYNRSWKAQRRTTAALVPIGYSHGFRGAPHNARKVLVGGRAVPIIGSVTSTQTLLDVTDVTGPQAGDEVIILGSQGNATIRLEDIAHAYQCSAYEVTAGFSDRLPS